MSNKIVVPRREFLLAGAAAVPLLGVATSRTKQGVAIESPKGAEASGAAETCRLTEESQYGPFYREGAPWRAQLCGPEEPGERLTIAGRVTAAGTCEPLKDAVLDLWQASAAGFYDNNDPARPFDPARYNLRGRVRTDAEGRYQFETVLPGNYGQGRFTRAKHIHLLATCAGRAPLVTEIYFAGDKHNDTDGLVRRSLITQLSGKAGERGAALRGTFDITLAKAS
jgi:catechol 1,2-dioxygenase